MKKIAVLGSTGSIGTGTLDVVARFRGQFSVTSLSTHSNITLLARQAKIFKPQAVCVVDKNKAVEFRKGFTGRRGLKVYDGEEGLCSMIGETVNDIVLVGIIGSAALYPLLTAIDTAKSIALANKEALVMAGDIIIDKARKRNVRILPVDSEHSAVFQCIESRKKPEIKNIYLTGSGGPLLRVSGKKFKSITPAQAVNHPRWKMGKKISVDSATMMNKGLEVIEAHHLFGVEIDKIKVLIHPEAIVHSMVEFLDGAILAQLGTCDMRIPIQYAITYPSRSISPVRGLDFSGPKSLNFQTPDFNKFPCLRIAYEAARKGKTYPCVLNASNEIAVDEFLRRRIGFTHIPEAIEKVLTLHNPPRSAGLNDILEVDKWARIKTREILSAING